MTVQAHQTDLQTIAAGLPAQKQREVVEFAHRKTNQAFGWGFLAHQDVCKRAFEEFERGEITVDQLRQFCTTGEV